MTTNAERDVLARQLAKFLRIHSPETPLRVAQIIDHPRCPVPLDGDDHAKVALVRRLVQRAERMGFVESTRPGGDAPRLYAATPAADSIDEHGAARLTRRSAATL